jgi:hypothetical protein
MSFWGKSARTACAAARISLVVLAGTGWGAFAHAGGSSAAPTSYADELVQSARAKGLASSRQWLRLGHYKAGLFGGQKSDIVDPRFYLVADGRTDPQAELEATIRAFFSDQAGTREAPHPQCKYPARYLWLKRELAFDPTRLAERRCEHFENFKNAVRAKSVSVVFSSYFLNSPSSAFGHSFIRLNKTEHSTAGERHELLDYGIGYAANINGENPIIYSFKGLFGLFPGTFTSMPYYYKVREYSDFESRDLWEYDVNFTQPQVDLLVAHIWELGSTYFAYWYITANCSYQALTVLEAANPDLTLTERQSKVVIPSDTIKVIESEPGFVNSVHLRPSIRAIFEKRLEQVPPARQADLMRLVQTHDPRSLPADMPATEKVAVLDAATDYLDMRYSHELIGRDGQAAAWKQGLLVARSQVPVPSPELDMSVNEKDPPHLSHGSGRAFFDAGYSRDLGAFERLSYRFALHDLLDPGVGYPPTAKIEMFSIAGRHDTRDNRFSLESLQFFNVLSLSPVTRFDHAFSWEMGLADRRFYDRTCDDYCNGADLVFGGGYALNPFGWKSILTYLMAEAELAASPRFLGTHFRPGVGPGAGIRIHFTDNLITLIHGGYRYQGWVQNPHTYEGDWNLRWAFRRPWAVNLRAAAEPATAETSLGLMFYH